MVSSSSVSTVVVVVSGQSSGDGRYDGPPVGEVEVKLRRDEDEQTMVG